jgi:hypothetical protein
VPDVDRLLEAIDAASEVAYGGDHDAELMKERGLALDYYYGRNVEPAPDGRSQVVDRSVFETVQWILPSLCRIFANGDDIVEFVPFGPEDEAAAKQEGDYLNYLVTQRNPWFQIFLTWAQDAMLTKNAYCLVYIEEKLHLETERYEGQTDEGFALLTQDEGVEIVELESYPAGEPQVVQDPMTGQPTVVPPPNKHNLTIRRVLPERKLRFRVLPPERTLVSEQTESFSLADCDYFEYFDFPTISDLRAQGFDVPDDIASDEEASEDVEDSRNLYGERSSDHEQTVVDPSMKRVKARMIWIRYDYDEDGIAELQKVLRVGRHIIDREEANRIPVASIVPNINTHRHIGTSVADMVADIQRIKTAILRQGLDNLYLSNNPRNLVSGKVNLDDLSVSAPGYQVRMLDDAIPAEGHIVPIPTPFVFPQAMEGLEYMGQIQEGRTGVSRAFAGVDPNTLNKGNASGTAINQLSTMASQRVEQIARIIASGVEYLFSVAHELVIKSGHEPEVVKLRGQWTQVDPSTWKTGRDMRICVGYGAGNKDALAARLVQIMSIQREMLAGGMRTANEQNVYAAAVELAKASDFTTPQRFFTDPQSLPPPEPKPTEAEIYAGVEQQKLQSSEREKIAEISSQERIKAEEIAQKDRQAQLQAELQIVLKQMEAGQTADLERLRGALKDNNERVKAGLADNGDEKRQIGSTLLDKVLADVAQTKEEANRRAEAAERQLAEMSGPKEIVRENGRVVGVKQGGKVRRVNRDKDNRITGLQ